METYFDQLNNYNICQKKALRGFFFLSVNGVNIMLDSFVFQQSSDRLKDMELRGFNLAPSTRCKSFYQNFQQVFVL